MRGWVLDYVVHMWMCEGVDGLNGHGHVHAYI